MDLIELVQDAKGRRLPINRLIRMADGSIIDPADPKVQARHGLTVVRTYGELRGQRYEECVERPHNPKHRLRVECKTALGSWVEVKLGYIPTADEIPEGMRLARFINGDWAAINTGTPTLKRKSKKR